MAAGASLALASAPAASAAPTCTDSWVGNGGNWFVATNWSTGAVPGPNDAVCITAPGNYTVTVPGGPTGTPSGQAVADTLQLGAASGTQKLVIEADNSCGDSTGAGGLELFDHGGAITAASIGPNGQVELTQDSNTCPGEMNGTAFRVDAGALSSAGLITSDTGGVAGSAVTAREIHGTVLNAGGNVTVGANTSWVGTSFDNTGTITFPSAAVLSVPAGSGATFSDDNGGVINNVDPDGHVLVDSGNTFRMAADTGQGAPYSRPGAAPAVIIDSAALVYTGTAPSNIEIQGQSTLVGNLPTFSLLAIECSGNEPAALHTGSFTNAGSIGLFGASPETCKAGRTLSVDSSAGPGTGTVTNVGQIEGSGTVAGSVSNTAGAITPGDSFFGCTCAGSYTPGQITITGNYEQDPNGSLDVLTAGSGAPGAGFSSQLSVEGAAALNGRLSLSSGFVGRDAPGETYRVLTAVRVTGRFTELDGQPAYVFNSEYVPVYNPTTVDVTVMKIPKLTVKLAGKGWGEVDSDPPGITCAGGTCTSTFPPTQVVTLTAIPSQSGPFEPPATFVGWSGGGCHGTGSCRLTLDDDTTVTATFVPPRSPRCTLRLKSRRPTPTLTAVALCNKTTRVTLSATVTEWLGSQQRPHTKHFRLRPVTRKAIRGRTTIFVVKLPSAALAALEQGRREAMTLKLQVGGTGPVSTRQIALHG